MHAAETRRYSRAVSSKRVRSFFFLSFLLIRENKGKKKSSPTFLLRQLEEQRKEKNNNINTEELWFAQKERWRLRFSERSPSMPKILSGTHPCESLAADPQHTLRTFSPVHCKK
jgi:hypothetical protein